MKQSPLFQLNWHDILKGLVMAILTPVVFTIEQTIQTGNLNFNWKAIGTTALAGGLAYLGKNLFTPAAAVQTVTTTPEGKVTDTVIGTDQVKVEVPTPNVDLINKGNK